MKLVACPTRPCLARHASDGVVYFVDRSRDGHSFLLIGPTGQVLWRADYGGSPNYTMYLPVATILRDLRNATTSGASGAPTTP